MYTLWDVRVDTGKGKELYGDDYADIYAINRLHFKAAMSEDCDHFHDGLGFLTSHTLISNTFEYSLQRVNPKLTLPYWDFTIEDSEAEISIDDDDVKIISPLFQESWFGSTDPDDNIVKDGRWANTEIPRTYQGNPGDLHPDVYGLLRSRWNVNSSPYLTRGMGTICDTYDVTQAYPWPTCELHYEMATEYSDFYSWVWTGMYGPHGPVHAWIGGAVNCEETLTKVSSLVGEDNAMSLALNAVDQRQNFWRAGFFSCEGMAEAGATEDEVFSEGMCGCLGFDLSQSSDDWRTIYYDSPMDFDSVISEYDDETKRMVVAEVCASTIHDGDHLHAGSSIDPTFWPMHPTMERLFMFARLTGNTYDMDWPDYDSASPDETISRYGDDCIGHGGSDEFPFDLLAADHDGFEIKTGIKGNPEIGNSLTNREVLAAIDARVNQLPYVYDTFKWDHCLGSGYDFDAAWDFSSTISAENKGKSTMKNEPTMRDPVAPLNKGGARPSHGSTKKARDGQK
ncbi:unnamed protein product [Ectocarpus fasciculatus]